MPQNSNIYWLYPSVISIIREQYLKVLSNLFLGIEKNTSGLVNETNFLQSHHITFIFCIWTSFLEFVVKTMVTPLLEWKMSKLRFLTRQNLSERCSNIWAKNLVAFNHVLILISYLKIQFWLYFSNMILSSINKQFVT